MKSKIFDFIDYYHLGIKKQISYIDKLGLNYNYRNWWTERF